MSLTLIKYPIEEKSGKIFNIFAGFNPVEIEFSRQDISIVGVFLGVDSKILIKINSDLTSNLNAGEWIYLYAEGATYTYNASFKILDINFSTPDTFITIDGDFIEVSSLGYLNYKQDYFVESKLVDADNNNIQIYPDFIEDNGTASGKILLNVSNPVDYLQNDILKSSGEITESRTRFNVKYREVWRENQSESFVLLNEIPIIIVYSAEDSDPEKFVNGFDIPKIWEGYNFNLAILHSLKNNEGKRYSVIFDQLNINQDTINETNPLFDFSSSDFGFMQVNMSDNHRVIDANTRYLRFSLETNEAADYETTDYNDTDYLTINT